MEEIKNTHGGKREGSGRKSKVEKKFTFGAVKEVADLLTNFEGNRNELINNAILSYLKKKN